MKEIGAQRDSGHTQKVKSLLPSHSGTGTPHSMLPDKRNGTRVLPVRQLILRSESTALALSLSSKDANTKVTDGSVESSVSSDIRNTQHHIGIPVNVYYDILGGDNVNFYAYAGGTVEKCVSDRYEILSTSVIHKNNPSGVQLSANAGIGVEFMLGKHLGLYLDPSLRYYFNCNQPKSIRTVQPLTLGFEMGLRVNL